VFLVVLGYFFFRVVRLGEARLSGWHVTPLLDNRLLDLPGVGAGPGAHLLGDVHTLLSGLKKRDKLGDMLALLLWLKVASLLWHLLSNGLGLVKTFLWARLQLTARWATKLAWNLLTLGLWRILLDTFLLLLTDLLRPLGTLLLGGISLSDILTLLLLNGLTLNDIIFNVMLVVPGLTLRLIDGLTLNGSLTITNEWGITELDLLFRGNGLVLNKAALPEILLTLLLLLGLKVSSVGGVTLLAVAVLALNDVIILSLLNHNDLVNAPFSSSSNGSNVQRHIILTPTLTSISGWQASLGNSSMIMMMIMGSMLSSTSVGLVEWKSSPQVLALPIRSSGRGTTGHQGKHANTLKTVHGF